jgi:hypothetical protein
VVTSPDRVTIWASQLAANDFPPVCAMSGMPAETWRKFKFATPPTWAYALLLLICLGGIGIIAYVVVIYAIAQRAEGHLPLTRISSRTVTLAIWVPASLLIAWIVLWVIAAAAGLPSSDPTVDTIAGVMFWIGLLLLLAGLVGRYVVKPLVTPRARVTEPQPGQFDKLVELRSVHPAFVAAVHQLQAGRMARSTGSN